MCFDTRRFWGMMGIKFFESSLRVMAFDNAVQAMYHDKVTPDAGGQYWGGPPSDPPSREVHGDPRDQRVSLPHNLQDRGSPPVTLAHCRVQLAVQRISRSAPTHSRVIDLFDIQSSQESHDRDDRDPPPPPPQRHHKKRKLARYAGNAVQCRSISKEEEEDVYDDMDFDDEGDNEYDGSL